MKLQFDKNLEYQHQAIASIVDLFRGQTPMKHKMELNIEIKRLEQNKNKLLGGDTI